MIKIIAKNIVKEDQISEFRSLAKPLVQESQKEEGCISYDLYEEVSNPCVLTFIEEWKNEQSIELHRASNHFKTICPQFEHLLEQPAEVNLYKVITQ